MPYCVIIDVGTRVCFLVGFFFVVGYLAGRR